MQYCGPFKVFGTVVPELSVFSKKAKKNQSCLPGGASSVSSVSICVISVSRSINNVISVSIDLNSVLRTSRKSYLFQWW